MLPLRYTIKRSQLGPSSRLVVGKYTNQADISGGISRADPRVMNPGRCPSTTLGVPARVVELEGLGYATQGSVSWRGCVSPTPMTSTMLAGPCWSILATSWAGTRLRWTSRFLPRPAPEILLSLGSGILNHNEYKDYSHAVLGLIRIRQPPERIRRPYNRL